MDEAGLPFSDATTNRQPTASTSPGTVADHSSSLTEQFLLERLAALRTKLLDLTLRNRLINFRHSKGSGKFLRVIDELPDDLAKRLGDGAEMLLEGIPDGKVKTTAEDDELELAVKQSMRSDARYLEAVELLRIRDDDGPSDREMERLENELKARVAETLGFKVKAKPTLEQLAEMAGIDPAVDLAEAFAAQQLKGPRERQDNKKLRIRLTDTQLDGAVTGLFRENRLSIEERGVNNLFLCFGFLEWYESENSEKVITSPILLEQMSFARELRNGRYAHTLKSTGDGLVLNITLLERLKRDFGVVLPEIGEDQYPEEYFVTVAKILSSYRTWRVRRWITLAPLAFAKIAMFKDLDPAAWSSASQPIDQLATVRLVLAGQQQTGATDRADNPTDVSKIASAPDHDSEQHSLAGRVVCVADADSSQFSAVLDVLGGNHIVIEGPPGTGKSQTITNIIATALCEGKSVLFVAEKMAALEVVQSRLSSVGLGAFCLELHSGGRAAAIDVLRARKELKPIDCGNYTELGIHRDAEIAKLRAAVLALHAPYGALGLSAFELVWRIQATRDAAPNVDVRIEDLPVADAASVSTVVLQSLLADVTSLAALKRREAEDFGPPAAEVLSGQTTLSFAVAKNPWCTLAEPDLSNMAIGDMLRIAAQLQVEVLDLITVVKQSGMPPGVAPADLNECEAIAAAASRLPKLPPKVTQEMLAIAAGETLRPLALSFAEVCDERRSLYKGLTNLFSDTMKLDQASPASLAHASSLTSAALAAGITVSELPYFSAQLQSKAASIRQTVDFLVSIAQFLGSQAIDAASLETIAAVVRCCAGLSDSAITGRVPGLLDSAVSRILTDASQESRRLLAEKAAVEVWLRVDSSSDYGMTLKLSAALKSAGPLAFLSVRYRAARVLYSELAVDPAEKVRPSQKGLRLERLALLLRDSRRFNDDVRLKTVLGRLFEGTETDFVRATEVAGWADSVRAAISPLYADAERLRAQLLEAGDDVLRRLVALCRRIDVRCFEDIFVPNLRGRQPSELVASLSTQAAAAEQLASICSGLGLAGFVPVNTIGAIASDRTKLLAAEQALRESGPIERAMGAVFRGELTDVGPLRAALDHFVAVTSSGLCPAVATWLCEADAQIRHETLVRFGGELDRVCRGVRRETKALVQQTIGGQFDESGLFGVDVGVARLGDLAGRVGNAVQYSDGLQRLVDMRRLERKLTGAGLGGVLNGAERLRVSALDLPPAIERAVLVTLLREVVNGSSSLRVFSGAAFSDLRTQFAKLDRQWIERQRGRVLAAALSRRPLAGIAGPRVCDRTELPLILHELTKRRAFLPMRSLLRRAGRSVQQLCPCFMMSPLSVAEFLDPAGIRFDLLVIDEASQMRPQEALGAIARAKQIVIVGDPKQLPPMSFFDSTGGEQTVEDEESILDQAMKQITPPRRLKWHYRSRHQSLIAFSNKQFYDNELVVFPSPEYEVGNSGLSAVRVADGVYAAGLNQVEARRVVEAAVKHAMKNPNLSLGMVAMNKAQADLMADLWDAAVAADSVAAAFVSRHAATLEPVFVKNLENVQGDERDVMFISTVYGPDASGAFFQRFGPINNAGGHRRLNVLFTRSKRQMTIFTSIDPDKIAANDGQSGPAALKGMLTYALRGQLEIGAAPANAATESPFEQAVLMRLRARGLIAQPQVGVAGYRIDIGVADPAKPGRFVLGVECDGATYHSAKSVRDRDRLRQEVLERLGWKIHRIWSLDWWKTPDQEFERLMRAVEQAKVK